ncbi:ubiquinone biosynthesis accessory factor UbiJ [Acinetobacter larvae]|uniref:Ubiquinone biosynthesis accessory factor UbiJ n=1 Tax=Acinetobacter larvae TaxID=1789224 RepID=A0A1B2LW55_9GAMM|nr:hypothetical protein [Acinetobacter larvae]AOA57165.1 hypothetical protein BFG52_01555 [Acinetobacter larvae]
MWSILALGAAETFINRVIDLDSITRAQLNQLHGKMLRVIIDHPVLSVDVYFDLGRVRLEPTATGQHNSSSIFEQRPFDQAQHLNTATASLKVPDVVALARLLLSDNVGTLPVQGDYHLLQTLQQIMQQAEPDLAAHLSPWIGPNAAHHLAKVQRLPDVLKRNLHSKLFYAQDFVKEDLGVLAPRWQMDDLQQATRQLNQNIDRLAAKIQQLQARFSSQQN